MEYFANDKIIFHTEGISTYLIHVIIWTIFYQILCVGILPLIMNIFWKDFYNKKLKTDDERRFWIIRIISTINCLVVSVWGLKIFYTYEQFYKNHDIYFGNHECKLWSSASLGYFVFDTIYNCILYVNPVSSFIVGAHHLFLGIAEIYLLLTESNYIFMILLSINEFTTPFMNLRFFLSRTVGKKHFAYILNGGLWWLTWKIFRFIPCFYVFYLVFYKTNFLNETPIFGIFIVLFSIIFLTGLNIYWYVKITHGIYMVLKYKKEPKIELSEKEQQEKIQNQDKKIKEE